MATTYEKIQSTTLSSTATSIDFNSIAGTYTDLRLVLVGTCSANVSLLLRFNGVSGTSYSLTYLNGNGAGPNTTSLGSLDGIILAGFQTNLTNIFMDTIDIFSYAGSTNKTVLSLMANDRNGAGEINATVGLFRSTSAITSVSILPNSSTLASGFTATLYGILKA
jgi:hypothetical protein